MVQCKICQWTGKDIVQHRIEARKMHKLIQRFGKYPDSITINGHEILPFEVIEV